MATPTPETFPPPGNPHRPSGAVRFGVFEVDFEAGELRKRGLRVRLQEQPFRVLSLLLEQPGRVVSREELQSKLWPEDTFVDFDHGLNTAINKLRQALGDSASNPRFIETMHRRGYRFIAPVEEVGVTASPASKGRPAVEPMATAAAVESVDAAVDRGATSAGLPALPAGAGSPEPGTTTPERAASEPQATNAEEAASPGAAHSDELAPLRTWLRVGGAVVISISIVFGIFIVLMVFGFVQQRLAQEIGGQTERITPAVVNQARILAGQSSDYFSPSEQVWTADRFFVGGSTSRSSGVVIGAEDSNLFLGERYGSFQYVIPVMPGKYRLTLYFVEAWFGPGNRGGGGAGNRVFDVDCNGVNLLRRLDVYREAGGANRALIRKFDDIEPNDQGRIVITFLPQVNNGMVNAVELVPME